MKPGDLVFLVKLPKFWGGSDIRGKWGTVLEQGAHSERWMVLVEGRRISLHRNHFLTPEEIDAQAR